MSERIDLLHGCAAKRQKFSHLNQSHMPPHRDGDLAVVKTSLHTMLQFVDYTFVQIALLADRSFVRTVSNNRYINVPQIPLGMSLHIARAKAL